MARKVSLNVWNRILDQMSFVLGFFLHKKKLFYTFFSIARNLSLGNVCFMTPPTFYIGSKVVCSILLGLLGTAVF